MNILLQRFSYDIGTEIRLPKWLGHFVPLRNHIRALRRAVATCGDAFMLSGASSLAGTTRYVYIGPKDTKVGTSTRAATAPRIRAALAARIREC